MCMSQSAPPTGSTVLPSVSTPAATIPVAPPPDAAKPKTDATTPTKAAPSTSSSTGLNIPT